MADTTFTGTIKVASRIIDYLSSGLYNSPGACLKELINNSYDADATKVEVFVKPDADRIIIEDDGCGMSRSDFVSHFERISESTKRSTSDVTASGRPKIGKIGIGFIAANEICEMMEIYSTKLGSTELLHVTINFDEMRKPIEQRRRGEVDIAKADYDGEVLEAEPEAHYTTIYLTNVRGAARDAMSGEGLLSSDAKALSLYGLREPSILSMLTSPPPNSWKDFDLYSQTMLQVALNVPVSYFPQWLPAKLLQITSDFTKRTADLNFRLFYDGAELKKPIVFCGSSDHEFISRFDFAGKDVTAHGYFYVQHGTVKPQELQGLLIRIRHAAVGEYDHSFWGYSPSESSVMQRWVSAEIWADDSLEDAMNIDRRTLRDTSDSYVELRTAIHAHLKSVLTQARSQIYEAGNVKRRTKRLTETKQAVTSLAQDRLRPIAPASAERLTTALRKIDNTPSTRRAFERKYSIVEIYDIVLDIAVDLLPPDQMAELVRRLTARIGE